MEFIKATIPACTVSRTVPSITFDCAGRGRRSVFQDEGPHCHFCTFSLTSYICKHRNPNINTQRHVLMRVGAPCIPPDLLSPTSFTFWNLNAKLLNMMLGETASRNSIQSRERGLQFHIAQLSLLNGFII